MSTRFFLVFLCIAFLSGCTQYQTVRPQDVSVGSRVELVTKSDTYYKFKVAEVSESEIMGEGVQVRFDDIRSVKQEELTEGGEAAVSGALGGLSGLIIGVMLFASMF